MDHPTIVHLVRHAHVHNPREVVYGRMPRFRISDEGQLQALATAEALSSRPLSAIWSSPMLRARQTAGIIRRHHPDTPLRVSHLLIEVKSKYEGHPNVDADWYAAYVGAQNPYEREKDVVDRVRRFIVRARATYAGRQIVAVSHGDPIYFTILTSFGLPASGSERTPLSVLGLADDYPAVGSITTLTFGTVDPAERPMVQYLRPY